MQINHLRTPHEHDSLKMGPLNVRFEKNIISHRN